MIVASGDYPTLWKRGLIQPRVRERANHCCEQCGMEFHHGTNLAKTAVNRHGKPIVGTCHHIDENKQNCSMANLVYLCQSCHFTVHLSRWYPGKTLPRIWGENVPRWIVSRRIPYRLHPQMRMRGF